MKKWLKLWMLTMAFVAAMTAVVSTGKVEAQSTANNQVQVEISPYNGGVNDCSWDDYQFYVSWSSAEQSAVISWNINCIFWKHDWWAVTIQLNWDLTSSDGHTISWNNVKIKNGAWTWTPSDLGAQDSSANDFINFVSTWASLFNKNSAKIWDASGTNIEIQVVVPAWQPNGTYSGTLVLYF